MRTMIPVNINSGTGDKRHSSPVELKTDLQTRMGLGDIEAAYRLGLLLESERNNFEAANCFKFGAKHNHVNSILKLADAYNEGRGVIANSEEARRWLIVAANLGSDEALYQIGLSYELEKNYFEAASCFKKAVKFNHIQAMLKLAVAYIAGRGVIANHEKAKELLTVALNAGDECAARRLFHNSLQELLDSADSLAQYQIGLNLINSSDSAIVSEGEKWIERSAERGCKQSIERMIRSVTEREASERTEFPQFNMDSITDLLQEARHGRREAQFQVALRYENGIGVLRCIEEALIWYERAFHGGFSEAKIRLDLINKRLVSANNILAAAKLGYASSQFTIGMKYILGDYLTRDALKGIEWIDKSSKAGFNQASEVLSKIYELASESIQERIIKSGADDPLAFASLVSELGEYRAIQAVSDNGFADFQYLLACLLLEGRLDKRSANEPDELMRRFYSHDAANKKISKAESLRIAGFKDDSFILLLEALVWGNVRAAQLLIGSDFSEMFEGDSRTTLVKWLASTGSMVAQVDLAKWYLSPPCHFSAAVAANYWLEKASRSGSLEAKFILGKNIVDGLGCLANKSEAMHLIQEAARKAYLPAQEYLFANPQRSIEPGVMKAGDVTIPGEVLRRAHIAKNTPEKNDPIVDKIGAATNEKHSARGSEGLRDDSDKPSSLPTRSSDSKPKNVLYDDPRRIVFLDFETTGLSAARGDRVIEVGAIVVSDGEIVQKYESLVNPGIKISQSITNITGITNKMLMDAPTSRDVMLALANLVGRSPLVAHNAKFDKNFLVAEFTRFGLRVPERFFCTLLLSRRIFPGLTSYSLSSLAQHFLFPCSGQAHRALPDVEQTVMLWERLIETIRRDSKLKQVSFDLISKLQVAQTGRVQNLLSGL